MGVMGFPALQDGQSTGLNTKDHRRQGGQQGFPNVRVTQSDLRQKAGVKDPTGAAAQPCTLVTPIPPHTVNKLKAGAGEIQAV